MPAQRPDRAAGGLLALLSNLAVIGFIYWRTHDEAVATLRRQVAEQAKVLTDIYRTGGKPALEDAVQDSIPSAIRRPRSRCSTPTGAR